MTEQRLEDARQRAASYHYEDGTIEVGHGAVYTALGLLLWIFDTISGSGEYKWLFAGAIIAFSLVSAVMLVTLVKRYKEKITFPRTGRVHYERPAKVELRDAGLLIGLSLLLAAGVVLFEGWFVSPPMIVGATITLILFFTGLRAGLLRLKVLAFVPILIAIPAAYFGMDSTLGSALAIGGSGLASMLAGLLAMRRYLAANPTPEDDEA